jgi:hypothetical protein
MNKWCKKHGIGYTFIYCGLDFIFSPGTLALWHDSSKKQVCQRLRRDRISKAPVRWQGDKTSRPRATFWMPPRATGPGQRHVIEGRTKQRDYDTAVFHPARFLTMPALTAAQALPADISVKLNFRTH